MAEPKTGKSKKKGRRLADIYTLTGNALQRKNRACPKCGPGTFMGTHSNRVVCGKCQYVEYGSRPSPAEK